MGSSLLIVRQTALSESKSQDLCWFFRRTVQLRFIKTESDGVWLKCVSFYQKGKTLILFSKGSWLFSNIEIKEFFAPLFQNQL